MAELLLEQLKKKDKDVNVYKAKLERLATKYEQKAVNENRDPHWFIFKKILG